MQQSLVVKFKVILLSMLLVYQPINVLLDFMYMVHQITTIQVLVTISQLLETLIVLEMLERE